MFRSNLLHLLHICDPALPIGGFSHSAGLETYVQQQVVRNKQTALRFIQQQLKYNICFTDAAFVSLAWQAAITKDWQSILTLDEECSAIKLPKEMRMASTRLSTRLLKIFATNNKLAFTARYWNATQQQLCLGHYSIAFGVVACELGIDLREALTGFYYNAAAGFVTNSVKLIPLGQQDGQDILMEIFPLIEQLVEISMDPEKEMLGYCCPGFDISSMQHEQLYSRLFMS